MSTSSPYAPVLIPTLCRYEHFKRCIESLSACTGAEHTDVYIGLDYPAKESHRAGYEQIKNFTLMPEPFTLDKGEITNTLKIKRGVLMKRYADIIEKMYVEK